MLIDPKETIAGVPAKRLRDALRRFGDFWTLEGLKQELGARLAKAVIYKSVKTQ